MQDPLTQSNIFDPCKPDHYSIFDRVDIQNTMYVRRLTCKIL